MAFSLPSSRGRHLTRVVRALSHLYGGACRARPRGGVCGHLEVGQGADGRPCRQASACSSTGVVVSNRRTGVVPSTGGVLASDDASGCRAGSLRGTEARNPDTSSVPRRSAWISVGICRTRPGVLRRPSRHESGQQQDGCRALKGGAHPDSSYGLKPSRAGLDRIDSSRLGDHALENLVHRSRVDSGLPGDKLPVGLRSGRRRRNPRRGWERSPLNSSRRRSGQDMGRGL